VHPALRYPPSRLAMTCTPGLPGERRTSGSGPMSTSWYPGSAYRLGGASRRAHRVGYFADGSKFWRSGNQSSSSPRRNGRRELAARTLSKHGTNRWRENYPPSMTGTCDRHNGLRRPTMWLGITSSAALLLFTVSAFADSCIFSAAPPFQLRSDAVDWTMQIASGTSCTRGLKLGPITISGVN
jgi:hypothetical protein